MITQIVHCVEQRYATAFLKHVNMFLYLCRNVWHCLFLHPSGAELFFPPSPASWSWALTLTTARPLTHLPRHHSLPWYWHCFTQKIDEPGRWVLSHFVIYLTKIRCLKSLFLSLQNTVLLFLSNILGTFSYLTQNILQTQELKCKVNRSFPHSF